MSMSMDGQGTKWRRKIAENFDVLSRVHERCRQTDDRQTDRQTDGRQHIANVNVKFTFALPTCTAGNKILNSIRGRGHNYVLPQIEQMFVLLYA